MSTPTLDAAREWLARADTNPEHAHRWWELHPEGTAILPVGRLWDAVEIPPSIADRLVGHPAITGPVLRYDTHDRAYVLVPPGTADTWTGQLQCLGDVHYLTVPDPSRTNPHGVHWAVPPDGSGALTDPTALAEMLRGVAG